MSAHKFAPVPNGEDPLEALVDNQLVQQDEDMPGRPRSRRSTVVEIDHRRPVVMVACMALVSLVAAATGGFLSSSNPHAVQQVVDMTAIQTEFVDESDVLWQAPGQEIRNSDTWSDCKRPHMSPCNGFCCCDAGHFWATSSSVLTKETGDAGEGDGKTASPGSFATKEAFLAKEEALGYVPRASTAQRHHGQATARQLSAGCVPASDVPEILPALAGR